MKRLLFICVALCLCTNPTNEEPSEHEPTADRPALMFAQVSWIKYETGEMWYTSYVKQGFDCDIDIIGDTIAVNVELLYSMRGCFDFDYTVIAPDNNFDITESSNAAHSVTFAISTNATIGENVFFVNARCVDPSISEWTETDTLRLNVAVK